MGLIQRLSFGLVFVMVQSCSNGKVRQRTSSGCTSTEHCDPSAVCTRLNGVDLCSCPPGFDDVMGDGSKCVDVDECIDPESRSRCGNGGSCVNTAGGYSCNCLAGFADVNGFCVDVDECSTSEACGSRAICLNREGSFECQCDEGYEPRDPTCSTCERGWVDDGAGACVATVIDCSNDPSVCAPGGACRSDSDADRCQCEEGHTGIACGRCAEGFQDNDGNGICTPSCSPASTP